MTISSKIGRLVNLGSSSKGNSFYIELLSNATNKPLRILLEVGFDFNELLKRMVKNGIKINDIDLVLVSHKHTDHSASMVEFVKRGVPVYAPKQAFEHHGIFYQDEYLLEEYKWKKIGFGTHIMALPLEHFDKGEKVETFGFILNVDNEMNMLFATDTKYIPQDLSKFNFDVIFIEANYLEDTVKYALLDAEKSKDANNISRYARLVDSHMSLENMVRTLDGSIREGAKPFNLSKTQLIFLIHLSSNRKTNETYYKEFTRNYLERTKSKTRKNDNLKIVVCKREGCFL
jgi:phosphoribosyl 1,2-cyclic phosphodiesterase